MVFMSDITNLRHRQSKGCLLSVFGLDRGGGSGPRILLIHNPCAVAEDNVFKVNVSVTPDSPGRSAITTAPSQRIQSRCVNSAVIHFRSVTFLFCVGGSCTCARKTVVILPQYLLALLNR
jgi:hypothetical protein